MLSIRRMTEKDLGPLTALLAARAHAGGRDAVIECSPSHAASRRVAEK